MNNLFKDMIMEGWIVIYMDDILLYSSDPTIYKQRTRRVIERLKENNLFLKPEKCVFDAPKVEFLRILFSADTIEMDPAKLKGIREWPAPIIVKGVRSFLGFTNFYRKFIHHYSELARPLHELTKKDKKWNWIEECQKAFDLLKEKFTSAPVLRIPDSSKPFEVESDASKFVCGAVLHQQDMNRDWRPCAYHSKFFSKTERNYQIYDRELLGIVSALEAWRYYIDGNSHTTKVLSDHQNLTYFRDPRKLDQRQARWALFLSQFDLNLKHVPRKTLIQSDAISHLEHLNLEEEDNKDITLLPNDMFIHMIEPDVKQRIKEISHYEEDVRNRIKLLTNEDLSKYDPDILKRMKQDLFDWQVENRLVFYKGRCYVPEDQDLRRDLVQLYHDTIAAGHLSENATFALLQKDYWWLGMRTFVKYYIAGCIPCQQIKPNTHPT